MSMGRRPNNAEAMFKPRPRIDQEILTDISDKVIDVENVDIENMEMIYSKLKTLKPFFDSVEISNSKEMKPARDTMAALESKYRKMNNFELELIDANIAYLRVQKKISKNDMLAKDSMCYCDEAELHYLKAVKPILKAMIEVQKELIGELDLFEKLINEIKAKLAKKKK